MATRGRDKARDSQEASLSNFADAQEPFNEAYVPIYWHIPKSGGSAIKNTIGACHQMVMATEFGITDGHDTDTEIAVVFPKHPNPAVKGRSPFVNVDVSTPAGIERAAKMGFAEAGLADCIASPLLFETNNLFSPSAKGRVFAVFRDPVERAVSMFYYLQVASWEPTYQPELKNWTLAQYAKSDIIENDWMVRMLSREPMAELNQSHLDKSIDLVRRKFMVGLTHRLTESMTRFERFFRWKYIVHPNYQETCREDMTTKRVNSNEKNKKSKPKPGDRVYNLLLERNRHDMQLYQYVEKLFDEQEALVADIPEDFRKINTSCCKCNPPTDPPEGLNCPPRFIP